MLSSKLLQKQNQNNQPEYYQIPDYQKNQYYQDNQKIFTDGMGDEFETQSRANSGSSNEKQNIQHLPQGFGPNKRKKEVAKQQQQVIQYAQTQSLTPGIRYAPLQRMKKVIQKQSIKNLKNDKNKKNHKVWLNDYKIVRLTGIQELSPNESKKKRFKISFIYNDKQNKQHSATVRFGDRSRPEFIDTQDHNIKNYRLGMLGDVENKYSPFMKQYWNYYILNQQPTIQQAEAKFKEQFQLI